MRWLKYGCLTSLGCLALLIVGAAFVLFLGWSHTRSEHPEQQVLTHEVPALPAPAEPPAPVPARRATERLEAPRTKRAGRLLIDLSQGEFHIVPGKPNQPIRVEATYDKGSFELKEATETAPDGTWTYRVEFGRIGSATWFVSMAQQIFASAKPVVRIQIPPDVPIELEAAFHACGGDADIGGLHLTSAAFNVYMGGLRLSVSEPMQEPMQRLQLDANMGGGEFNRIGNASPRVLEVTYQMGGIDLDLSGGWSTDSEITLRGSQGGASVNLPDDARVEGIPNRPIEPPEAGEIRKPTLRFTAGSRFEDVKVR